MLPILHIDGRPTFVRNRCESLHLVIGQAIHGDVLALDVRVSRHVYFVLTLGLLSHILLFSAI